MNAIELSAPAGMENSIVVTLRVSVHLASAGRIAAVLGIQDRGPGLPVNFDLSISESLGLTVAQQFAVALGGNLILLNRPGGGTVARLRFTVDPLLNQNADHRHKYQGTSIFEFFRPRMAGRGL